MRGGLSHSLQACENNYPIHKIMSHPPEGLFGESVDYSTAHISGKAKNGNIFNWEGETIQRQWDDEYIINTRKDEEGVVTKTVYLGDFDFKGNTLFTSSTLRHRATFYLFPEITKGDTYLGDGIYEPGKIFKNVEAGYVVKYEPNTPYPLGSEGEHNRLLWEFSSIGEELTGAGSGYPSVTGNVTLSKNFKSSRDIVEDSFLDTYLPEGWYKNPFSIVSSDRTSEKPNSTEEKHDFRIDEPGSFHKKFADKITNFNPSTDTLEIDTYSFGIDSSATFAAGANKKEVKKVLAKQDFDFLYDQKKGGLYFNENGADKGFGDGGIIAILKGAPELTSSNLQFI